MSDAPSKTTGASLIRGSARRVAVENLSLLISSGVDPASALRATADSSSDKRVRLRLKAVAERVEGGEEFWRALQGAGLLALHQVWLVRIGEESGTLTHHMDTLVAQERSEDMFRHQLSSALLYPAIVVFIGVVVGGGVAWIILPRLLTVFATLKVELPLLTRILLAVVGFLGSYGAWFVPLMLCLIAVLFYVLFVSRGTRYIGQSMLLRVPGLKRLIREVEIARFGSVLGTLLKAGVPVPQALEALADVDAFHPYPRLYRFMHERVSSGETFAEALDAFPSSARYLPPTVAQILSTASESGQLADATTRLGLTYQQRLESTTKDVLAILEPLTLFVVWIGVVLLAASIITPIYSVLRGINQ